MLIKLACLLAISLLAKPGLSAGLGLPDGTKGTLNLSVAVQDELGVDTVSEMVELKHVKASELEGFIRTRLSRWGTVQTNDALNMVIITDKREKLRDLSALVRRLDDSKLKDFLRLETVSLPLKFTAPDTLVASVQSRLSPEGRLSVDHAHNALVITDLKSKIDSVRDLVLALDQFIPQVTFEVVVAEGSNDGLSNTGLDWGFLRAGFRANAGYNLNGSNQNSWQNQSPSWWGSSAYSSNYSSGNWSLSGYADMDTLLNLIVNNNKGKIALRTRMATANNETVRLNSGNRRSGYSRSEAPEPGRDDGLFLSLKPRVGWDDVVTLDIDASMNDFQGWAQDGQPILNNRSLISKVVLKNGQTLALGGLQKTVEVESQKGIPGLRLILPFIFSRKVKSQIKNDLMIFVTAHVQRDFQEASAQDLKSLPEAPEPK